MKAIWDAIDSGGRTGDTIFLGVCLLIIVACMFWPAKRGL